MSETPGQVFQLAGHLLYWGKATVIYPLCESNLYVLSPHLPTPLPLRLRCLPSPSPTPQ